MLLFNASYLVLLLVAAAADCRQQVRLQFSLALNFVLLASGETGWDSISERSASGFGRLLSSIEVSAAHCTTTWRQRGTGCWLWKLHAAEVGVCR